MKTRRKYDQEFKQMAIELSHHREDIWQSPDHHEVEETMIPGLKGPCGIHYEERRS